MTTVATHDDLDLSAEASGPADSFVRRHAEWLVLGVIVIAAVAAMFATHRHGHWWGDDWALYVRQAQGLVDGNADQVRLDNEFTVTTTPGTEFSPPLYPWGFPLLLAPFVAVFGSSNLDRLAILEVLCAAAFVVAWYMLARRRLPPAVTLVGAIVLAFSPLYVGWSEQIQSELPFMAVAMWAVVYVDRVNRRGALVDRTASWWPPVAVGLAAAAAFTVRREGLALLPAIFVAQLVGLAALWPRRPTKGRELGMLAARLAVPYVAAYGSIQLLQAALPSTLVPRYRGTGLGNITKYASTHVGNVMKSLGFQRQWATSPAVFGNEALGTFVVGMFIVLVVTGIAIALARHAARDLPLLAYVGTVLVIGASFRVASSRYVATVGPILLIFAALTVVTLLRRRLAPVAASLVVASLLVLLAVSNAWQVKERVDYARDVARLGAVEWGPMDPASVEMFEAVRELTAPDDVVGFFKARAMTLATDRRTLQVGGASWPVERATDLIDVVVLQFADQQYEYANSHPERFEPIWSNPRFEIFRILPAPTDN
jgi:Dolichyl-phosphate-mannose-protein mannosyltransferase